MTLLTARLQSLDTTKKWIIIGVLAFLLTGVGLKVYSSHMLKEASELKLQVEFLKGQESKARADAEALKIKADKLADSYAKANTKIERLQAALDKIKVPDGPTEYPASVGATLEDLRKMGLVLVIKPSLTVKPSVAGFTAEDAGIVWYWGKQSIRVPFLEQKLEATNDLVAGLGKAKTICESLVDTKTKEADAWMVAADTAKKEVTVIEQALGNTEKALKAERKKKILYGIGAGVLTYAVTRR